MKHYEGNLIRTLGKAIAYAAMAHQDQTDKQDVAYILHPIRVAEALRRDGWSTTYQLTAVIHDLVENTGVELSDIERHFGKIIHDSVDALTRRKAEGETYKDYIRRCCKDSLAMTVKKYDVYDNADPWRYCKDVPYSRYAWAMSYIQEQEAV
jgi:(p)ppGpp synthase/HD superfamily hydrolase